MNLTEQEKIYPDGERYESNFSNGEYCGKGTWYYLNGDRLEGIWSKGYRNGKFKKILKNGEEYIITYKNDIKIEVEKITKNN